MSYQMSIKFAKMCVGWYDIEDNVTEVQRKHETQIQKAGVWRFFIYLLKKC